MPYAERIDFVGEDTIYKGLAIPGSVDTAPVWSMCPALCVAQGLRFKLIA